MQQSAYEIEKQQIVEVSPKPSPSVRVVKSDRRKKAKARRISKATQVVLSGALMVSLMCAVLYVQAQSTAISGEIDKQEELLLSLESDNQFLENELEMRTNLKDVELYAATTLGLVKKDSSQIVYVQRENVSEIIYEKGVFDEIIINAQKNLFQFSEYISATE